MTLASLALPRLVPSPADNPIAGTAVSAQAEGTAQVRAVDPLRQAVGLSPALLLGAYLRAAALVLALLGLAWLLGLVPPATEGFAVLGVAAALLASGAAVLLKGGFLGNRAMASMHGDPRLLAGRLQGILAAGLVMKLAVVTVGVLAMRAQQLKFELVTTFAVAFAVASLVGQVTVAGIVWRALSRRLDVATSAGGSRLSTGRPS